MVIREIINEVTRLLRESGNDNALFEAHLIVRKALSLSPLDMVLKANCEAAESVADLIFFQTHRRERGEPLEYILGTQEFMGLDFSVNPKVLIPRHDTERLVEHVLKHFGKKPFSALDLCTGSGCIAVSLLHFNKGARITALDISPDAIETAKKNAYLNGVECRARFEVCDIFTAELFGKFDLIVSNPPYIETEVIPTLSETVKMYEPHLALDGGADGLKFYRHITSLAPKYLLPGGMLAFEIGYNQAEAVSALMAENFSDITVIKDYGGNDRVVSGILK